MHMEAITIIDSDYKRWVEDLSKRFRQSQIKAAVSVNSEMLRFYWELGRDIVEMHITRRFLSCFIQTPLNIRLKMPRNTSSKKED